MKVQIVTTDEEHVEGYEKVEIDDGNIDLAKFSDNECSFILASECLDTMGYDEVKSFILQARQKMRIGSSLVVGGTDIRLFARAIISGAISSENANRILSQKKSCADVNYVSKIMEDVGLSVVSTTVAGIHYEIEASR